ncbi:MAG TPA: phosphatase PAP2 family protein [Sphingobacteriaceae bacterium]|nr:phosphatase PAP2 family protein [Sphingobacteriaceae bacterium]
MIQDLIALDKEWFALINQGMSNPFFDWLLPILRNMFTWAPLYLFIIIFTIRNYKKEGVAMVAAILINFGISDWTSSTLIKKSVERIRPCNEIELREDIIVRVSCGSGYSFTSSHATNHMALAAMLSVLFYRRWKHIVWISILWALAIGFSQIYVGVHYPGDVIVGTLLGAAIGLINGYIFTLVQRKYFKRSA